MSDSIEMHAIVSGNVQGVGFRATTCSIANELRLFGTVRNLEDGSVEIVAQGNEKQLLALISRLKSFLGESQIDHVKQTFRPVAVIQNRFVILK
jgi:acylphosphatase